MFISFFGIATEPFKNQYPIKECIKSILPIADEIVLIYGREEKKSENYFKNISDKIKIYNTNKWPIDWSYDVMTYHFDYGLKKCTGDICIKFDIDFIFNCDDIEEYKKALKPYEDYHMIYLPRMNYLDKNHVRYFEKGIYAINKKLLDDENINYFIGVRNYVNGPFFDKEIKTISTGDENKNLWVFNFDCTFMNEETFKEKQYRWYNAYYKKYGEVKRFGLELEEINNKELLKNKIINRNIEKINYAIKKKVIRYIPFYDYPKIIRLKLLQLKEKHYGFNYFGNIDFSKLFYKEKEFDENDFINLNFNENDKNEHFKIFTNKVLFSIFF